MAIYHTVYGDPQKTLQKVRGRITAAGGSVTGTPQEGTFEVKGFAGNYTAGENLLDARAHDTARRSGGLRTERRRFGPGVARLRPFLAKQIPEPAPKRG